MAASCNGRGAPGGERVVAPVTPPGVVPAPVLLLVIPIDGFGAAEPLLHGLGRFQAGRLAERLEADLRRFVPRGREHRMMQDVVVAPELAEHLVDASR